MSNEAAGTAVNVDGDRNVEVIEILRCDVESALDFRSRKAVEYPSDARNQRSMEYLSTALDELDGMSSSDARIGVIAKCWDGDESEMYVVEADDVVSRYGFDRDESESLLDKLAGLAWKMESLDPWSLKRHVIESGGTLMTPVHPDWDVFCGLLAEELETQECAAGHQKPLAERVLRRDFDSVSLRETLLWLDQNGGGCDCEILINIDLCETYDPDTIP